MAFSIIWLGFDEMSLDLPKMSLIGLILADMRLIYARMMICLFFKHEQGVDPG